MAIVMLTYFLSSVRARFCIVIGDRARQAKVKEILGEIIKIFTHGVVKFVLLSAAADGKRLVVDYRNYKSLRHERRYAFEVPIMYTYGREFEIMEQVIPILLQITWTRTIGIYDISRHASFQLQI